MRRLSRGSFLGRRNGGEEGLDTGDKRHHGVFRNEPDFLNGFVGCLNEISDCQSIGSLGGGSLIGGGPGGCWG